MLLSRAHFHPTKSNRTCRKNTSESLFPPATTTYKDNRRGSGKRMSQAVEIGTQIAYLPNNSESLPNPNSISRPISSSSLIFLFCPLLSSSSLFSVPCRCSQLCLFSMEAKLLGASSPAIRSQLASDSRLSSLFALKTKQSLNFVNFKSSVSEKGIQSTRALAIPNAYRLCNPFPMIVDFIVQLLTPFYWCVICCIFGCCLFLALLMFLSLFTL